MLDSVPRFVLFLLGAVLGLSALALPEQSRAGCSPNLHWTDFGPVWSPTGDRIAYQRIEIGCFGPRRTYVIDSDGGAPAPMPLGGERPSWSPDGRRLAFSANLTVANADGSGYEELRRYPSRHPTWSPDGRFIAFAGGGWEHPDIYTIGSDGFGEQNITNTPGADESNPSWSPSGPSWLPMGLRVEPSIRAVLHNRRRFGRLTERDWRFCAGPVSIRSSSSSSTSPPEPHACWPGATSPTETRRGRRIRAGSRSPEASPRRGGPSRACARFVPTAPTSATWGSEPTWRGHPTARGLRSSTTALTARPAGASSSLR